LLADLEKKRALVHSLLAVLYASVLTGYLAISGHLVFSTVSLVLISVVAVLLACFIGMYVVANRHCLDARLLMKLVAVLYKGNTLFTQEDKDRVFKLTVRFASSLGIKKVTEEEIGPPSEEAKTLFVDHG
jgi:predicted ferric reductase